MPDWKQIVRKHFRVLKTCSPEIAEKFNEELAGHLEDSYEGHVRAWLTTRSRFSPRRRADWPPFPDLPDSANTAGGSHD